MAASIAKWGATVSARLGLLRNAAMTRATPGRPFAIDGRTSALGLGRVKTPTFNLRVETPSRFRKFENQKCLRPLLREDDRENNSAHSWLVHVFTQPGSISDLGVRSSQVRFALNNGHRVRFFHLCAKLRLTGPKHG